MSRILAIPLLLATLSGCASAPPPLRTNDLGVSGATIHYEVAGEGDPVVLIHGGYGDRRMWDEQIGPLSRLFKVVRYDHRGFGRSSRPHGVYSPASDLTALLDHLGIERAHLVGNSMGGTFAIDFALMHPERVRSLTLINAGADGYPYATEDLERLGDVFRAAESGSAETAITLFITNPMLDVARTMPKVRRAVELMLNDNRGIFTLAAWPQQKLTPPAYSQLGGIMVPTLAIIGAQDAAGARAASNATAVSIPGSKIERVEGGDHLVHMEKPEAVNKLLIEFLGGVR